MLILIHISLIAHRLPHLNHGISSKDQRKHNLLTTHLDLSTIANYPPLLLQMYMEVSTPERRNKDPVTLYQSIDFL